MRYLNESDLLCLRTDWEGMIDVLERAVLSLEKEDFAQPIKPYLRYRNLKNRIIAMPAFLGGDCDMAGIKWIASFPGNIDKGISRAHSVVVLNESDTGRPVAIINTPLLSILRTASVSGLILRYFIAERNLDRFNVGIIGFGPIGMWHLKMILSLYGKKINKIFLYDIRPVIDIESIELRYREKVVIVGDWHNAYRDSDVFVTCTVSDERYIDERPKIGSLQLNVSLRDYQDNILDFVKGGIIVDSWEEVCRENTDIENMHKIRGLQEHDVMTVGDVVCRNGIGSMKMEQVVMFNPMGMGVFDIAIAKHLIRLAENQGVGTVLK